MLKMINKDKIDDQIIQILQANARHSSQEIARQLNISPATIRRRINKLIKEGEIKIVALTRLDRINLPLFCIIALEVANEDIAVALQQLETRDEITWLSSTTGRFDVFAIAHFENTDELNHFLQKVLANIKGMKDSETFVCLVNKKGIAYRYFDNLPFP